MRGYSAGWHHGRRYCRDLARERGVPCGQAFVPADDAERAIGDYLGHMVLPDDWRARVMSLVREHGKGHDPEADARRIDGQLERLRKVFILGDIGEGEYEQECAQGCCQSVKSATA